MNGPNRPLGAPKDWFCNARTDHGAPQYRYNSRGRVEELGGPCLCSECFRKEHPGLREGEPVQCHEEFTVELLRQKGYVGLYGRP